MMKKKIVALGLAAVVALFLTVLPNQAFADEALSGSAPGTVYEVPNKFATPFLQVAIGNVARIMLGIAGTIALAVFVWGGVLLITSGGDANKVARGKKMMAWTAIGLVVMFAAEAIVRTVLDAVLGG